MTAGTVTKARKVMLNPRFFKYYLQLGGVSCLFLIGGWMDNLLTLRESSTFMNKSGCFPPRDLGPGNKRW